MIAKTDRNVKPLVMPYQRKKRFLFFVIVQDIIRILKVDCKIPGIGRSSGKDANPLSLNKYTYCHNQPVTGCDPDGHFLHIAVGAVIGAVVGGSVSAYSQYKSTGKVTFKKTFGAAVEGAVVGGVGAATAGANLGVTVAAGAAGNAANQLISTGKVDEKHDISNVNWKEVGGSALLGGGLGAGMGAASQTKSGQKVSASQQKWDKKLNAGIEKFKNDFKSYGQKAFAKSGTDIEKGNQL